jgi:hypothetical protein
MMALQDSNPTLSLHFRSVTAMGLNEWNQLGPGSMGGTPAKRNQDPLASLWHVLESKQSQKRKTVPGSSFPLGPLMEGPLLLSKGQSSDLGKLIDGDVKSLLRLGWGKFVVLKCQSDLHPKVSKLPHPAAHNLDHLRRQGAKVTMATAPWSHDRPHHQRH